MTTKSMFYEMKESKHFTEILHQSLKKELIDYGQEVLRKNNSVSISSMFKF